jgi:pimeloyl-ACP methyl ester carboxylesterase
VVAQTNKAPPPPGSPTIPTDATHFKVFTNGGFVTGIGLNPSKSTIVLTHGLNDSSSNWPLEMANVIKVELGSSTPNIVAWDWTAVAAEPLQVATLATQGQGYALGENLTNALGANYSQRIHFIGHSLGTLVNARAANFIHTNGFAWANTQMTLLDEAEVAWGTIEDTWQTATSLLQNDSAPQQDWKHPLPDQCAWADNYITAVGMPHSQAVNVILTNMTPDVSNIQNVFDFAIGAFTGQFKSEDTDYHNYSYIWYNNTVSQINNPNDPPYLMGFSRSWEGGGYAGRPSANTYYRELPKTPTYQN